MTSWLKQSTAATIKLGPFMDADDGKTIEGSLTISQADIRLSKNGGNYAQTNNATGATYDENGEYDIPLDTTDTNTLGRLRVMVVESGALPCWRDFMVVPANVYDSLVGGSDLLDTNASQLGGTSQTGRDIGASVLLSSGTGAGQILLSSGKVDVYAIAGENQTGVDLGGALVQLLPQFGNAVGSTGNTTTTIHLSGIATYGDDEIVDHLLIIFDGSTGESHSRWITAFNGTTDVATVATLPFTPQATVDLWTLTNIRRNTKPESLGTQAKADVNAEADTALSDYDPPTRTEATADKDAIIAQGDAAWATATGFSTHSAADVRTEMDANSTKLSSIETDTQDIQSKIGTPSDLDGGGATLAGNATDIINYVDTTGQAIVADTEDIQGRLPAALVGGRIDATVDGTGMEAGAVTAIQSGLATASALTTVDTVVDAIKVVTDALTAAAAAKLATSAGTMVTGTVDSTGHTPTTTEFEADDITEATADHFNGRIILFTSGALQYQATSISDYSLVSGRGHFTVVALTEAPANDSTFIII